MGADRNGALDIPDTAAPPNGLPVTIDDESDGMVEELKALLPPHAEAAAPELNPPIPGRVGCTGCALTEAMVSALRPGAAATSRHIDCRSPAASTGSREDHDVPVALCACHTSAEKKSRVAQHLASLRLFPLFSLSRSVTCLHALLVCVCADHVFAFERSHGHISASSIVEELSPHRHALRAQVTPHHQAICRPQQLQMRVLTSKNEHKNEHEAEEGQKKTQRAQRGA